MKCCPRPTYRRSRAPPFIAAKRRPRCTCVAMILLWLEEVCPSLVVVWPAGWPSSLSSSLVRRRTSDLRSLFL
jgi:hypothetical protein